MDLGLIIFTLFLISLGVIYFVDEYRRKLAIEKDKKPIASSFVRLFAEPNLRPAFSHTLSRVTVYNDIIVCKFTAMYSQGLFKHRNDVVDYNTGISSYTSTFKFLADHVYRLGHIITRSSIISHVHQPEKNVVILKYKDIDDQTHTLTIKKPFILTKSYMKLIAEINKFATKTS